MTNFRLFQTKRVCRRQFQIWRKWQKVIQTSRKHWEKEKLPITSNFSFSQSFLKRFVSKGRQKVSLCGNGLILHKSLLLSLLSRTQFFNSFPNNYFLDWTKFKVFAEDKLNAAKVMISVFDSVENIVWKGENAGFQHFLLFPWCFQKASIVGLLQVRSVW